MLLRRLGELLYLKPGELERGWPFFAFYLLLFGVLFVTREIAFTLVLMHFGTYLQDYFTRSELNRVLPVIYGGGRVGGIAGGWLLEHLSGTLGPLNVVPVFLGLCLACMAFLFV